MVISNEYSNPIVIDNVNVPLSCDYFWSLDLKYMDFSISPIEYLEEQTVPAFLVNIKGYLFYIPCAWNILVYSEETSQLDMIRLSDATKMYYNAVVYNHKRDTIISGRIKVIDYSPEVVITAPNVSKNKMMCHAIGEDYWVMLSTSDTYVKFLKNKVIGNLIP